MVKKDIFLTFGLSVILLSAFAQADGDYRTISGGAWTTTGIWERYKGTGPQAGRGWFAATAFPTAADNVITIQSGYTVNVPGGTSITIDQVQVTGSLLVEANASTNIASGAPGINVNIGGNISVSGTVTLQNNATWTNSTISNTTFLSGSRYVHGWTNAEGTVPIANWNPGSVLEVSGYNNSTTATAAGNWSQAFYDVVLNFTQLNASPKIVNFSGLLNNIVNNLSIINTGSTGKVRLSGGASNTTMNIGGNLSINAGAKLDITNGATGVTVNVNGNVTNSGLLTLAAVNTGVCTLNVKGNFSNQSGATVTTTSSISTATAGIGTITFNGASVQTFTNTGTISNHVRFNIPSGSIVDAGTSAFSGSGTFTLSGELRTAALAGLSTAVNGVFNGNPLGTKTFNANGTIQYNGNAPQFMGDLYPTAPPSGFNVIINNGSGVTTSILTTIITGNLNLLNGIFSSNANLQLSGTLAQTSGAISMASASVLTIVGDGSLLVDPFPFSGNQSFNTLQISRTNSSITFAHAVSLSGNAELLGGTLTLNAPFALSGNLDVLNSTLNGGSTTITMVGPSWNVDEANGGVFYGQSGTVIFDGNTTIGHGAVTGGFNNIQLNTTRSLDFPSSPVNVSGNIDFAIGSTFNASFGNVVLNGAGGQIINPNGAEFYGILVNKTNGAVNVNSALPLQGVLDIQSPTTITTNGHLLLLSRGVTTDLDGSIGPVPTGAAVNGNITMQRYMDPIGNTYRYVASPVSGALPPAEWGSGIYVYSYSAGVGGYAKHSTASPLVVGTGYVVGLNMSSPITWAVNGPVTTGSYTWNFNEQGWHLIGNPFPAAIRWFDSPGVAWDLNNIATTIAVTDNAVAGYPNYFKYWSYDPINNPGDWGSGELENGMVAMGQAFWVYVGAGGGSLTIYEQAKENTLTGEFYRTKSKENADVLKIMLDDGRYADAVYLKLNPKASDAFDFKHDLMKLWNPEMNLYLIDEDKNELVVNSIKAWESDKKLWLGIDLKTEGTYTLSFPDRDNFSYGDRLFLIDTYEGIAIPVSEGAYKFKVTTNSPKDRFYLSLNSRLPERKLTDRIQAYPNPVADKLTITMSSQERAIVQLMDNQGNSYLSAEIKGTHELNMTDYAKGMYILRFITTNGEVVTRKIIKQ